MNIQNEIQRSTMPALRAAGLNGNFTIQDLHTGIILNCRGAAGNNNHVDFMWHRRADFENVLRMLGRPTTAKVGTWSARPGILRFTNRNGTFAFAISYHTKNHSVAVASDAYNPSGIRIIRGQGASPHERNSAGNWIIGAHICMWTYDTFAIRGHRNNAYDRDMRDRVLEAERMAQAISVPAASVTVNRQVRVNVTTFLNIRTGAGVNFNANGRLNNGEIRNIIREATGPVDARAGRHGQWGQLQNGGWIALEHTVATNALSIAPPPPLLPMPDKTYRVQISASRDREATERLVERLRTEGAQQYAYLNHYGGLYRAQVGQFATREEARRLEQELLELIFVNDTYVKAA